MTKSARPESPKAIGVLKNALRTVIEPLHPPLSFSRGKIPPPFTTGITSVSLSCKRKVAQTYGGGSTFEGEVLAQEEGVTEQAVSTSKSNGRKSTKK